MKRIVLVSIMCMQSVFQAMDSIKIRPGKVRFDKVRPGYDVKATNDLFAAVYSKNIKEVQKAIDEGADVKALDNRQYTPLHWAAKNNALDIAALLIKSGADVNALDNRQYTPLHFAVSANALDVAKLLIDNEANVNAQTSEGALPLELVSGMHALAIAELLIGNGADVNAQDFYKFSGLHLAVLNNELDVAKLLIARGANVNVQDNDGKTPLHFALQMAAKNKAFGRMVKVLIENDATIPNDLSVEETEVLDGVIK
ncbi:ankyrin repeat domain-containing protein [Candidatus Babeliales bacterium]|nr:ankyrin repeat domain-containing protein [Candidatus Babeliales bacterium]